VADFIVDHLLPGRAAWRPGDTTACRSGRGSTGRSSRASGAPVDILLSTREAGLFRWALRAGMRLVKPMSLMTMGRYKASGGAWFPSVQY
jgi:hypothetical protein